MNITTNEMGGEMGTRPLYCLSESQKKKTMHQPLRKKRKYEQTTLTSSALPPPCTLSVSIGDFEATRKPRINF